MATIPVIQTLVTLLFGIHFSLSSGANSMVTGDVLKDGQSLTHNSYNLTVQSDCNLVLTDGNTPIWATMTNGYGPGCTLTLDSNGKLILKTWYGYSIWNSGKKSQFGVYSLVLRYDGTVNVYGPRLWTATPFLSTTEGAASLHGNAKITDSVLYTGDVAPIGTTIVNGDSELKLQDDCNLVMTFKGYTKWQTGVTDHTLQDCFVSLEANGEFMVKHWGGDVLWRNNKVSSQYNNTEFVLVLQSNAMLGVYGPAIWSGTASGMVNSDKIAMVTAAE